MGQKELEDLKKRMQPPKDKQSPTPQASSGMERPKDRSTEMRQTGGVPSGQKTISEKDKVAEAIIAEAKAKDVEDSREETSEKGTRHDLVSASPPNIPPTIQQERMRMGQHPISGEPWTSDERDTYLREQEDARRLHAEAVAESEQKMRDELNQPAPAMQPIPHVPITQLSREQLRAQQASQDRGESPVMQAKARDAATPEAQARVLAEKRAAMTTEEKRREERENLGVDEDLEKKEVEGEGEPEPDPDEIERQLEEKRGGDKTSKH